MTDRYSARRFLRQPLPPCGIAAGQRLFWHAHHCDIHAIIRQLAAHAVHRFRLAERTDAHAVQRAVFGFALGNIGRHAHQRLLGLRFFCFGLVVVGVGLLFFGVFFFGFFCFLWFFFVGLLFVGVCFWWCCFFVFW